MKTLTKYTLCLLVSWGLQACAPDFMAACGRMCPYGVKSWSYEKCECESECKVIYKEKGARK